MQTHSTTFPSTTIRRKHKLNNLRSNSLLILTLNTFHFQLPPPIQPLPVFNPSLPTTASMGFWGSELFENDYDHDSLSDVEAEIDMALYSYDIEELGGKGLEATRDRLNNGLLVRLFDEHASKPLDWFGAPKIVLIAICAMRIGATIPGAEMAKLSNFYNRHKNFRGRNQIRAAMKNYKNDGTQYRLHTKSLLDVANETFEPGNPYGIPRCQGPGCAQFAEELPEGRDLMLCGRCRLAQYCSVECQKADWKEHKKTCKAPAPPA
ncbi:hypothetical protein PVAG01_08882 [Phlyctema vagabunda]|uniref:MYND-type domain-containing protein n=1 Tax=Phlyctema vagabunda TaxID=108571 RepID=A0ABR4PAR9_9HELO